jgi:phage gpG-like protein
MPQNSDTAKELERKVERFISLTLKDIGTKIGKEFDRNFEREAFFNEHWARRKYNDDESRGLLTRTGALRRSIKTETTGHSVVFSSDLPYAAIHNEGGAITVTRKMKRYFWYLYRQLTDNYRRPPTEEAFFCKRMALKRAGSRIVMPCRRFIGMHPEVERIIREIVENNSKRIF